MSQLPIDEAINRFKDNEERLKAFVNSPIGYNTDSGKPVESIPAFIARKEDEINAADAIARTEANKIAAKAAADRAAISESNAGSSSSSAATSRNDAISARNDAVAVAAGLSAGGVVGKATKALLDADLAHIADTVAYVTNDETPSNNGIYRKIEASGSGSWAASSYDRVLQTEIALASLNSLVSSYGLTAYEALIDGVAYPFVIFDENKKAAVGISPDGRFVIFSQQGLTSADVNYSSSEIAGFKFAFIDANDKIAFGIKDDGSVFASAINEAVPNPNVPAQFAHINHIIHMGQSLGVGMESLPVVTSSDTGYGNIRFNIGVQTWTNTIPPSNRPSNQFSIEPLKASIGYLSSDWGETIANGLCDHLKETTLGKYSLQNPAESYPKFIFSCAGEGGRYIRELDKIHDDAKDPRAGARQTNGGYYATSIDDVQRAKSYADSQGLSYAVAAITWMQGEANNDLKVNRWNAPLSLQDAISAYKIDLIALKNNYNDDIKAITGQSGKIPFFMYQTLGQVSSVAQLQAAIENDDMYMASPTYFLPSAINSEYGTNDVHGSYIHLSADGQRWLGEHFGKVIRRVTKENENWEPLRPLSASINSARTEIVVRFSVPRAPLIFETDFIPAQGVGKGFEIVGSSGTAVVTSVSIYDPSSVKIVLAKPLASGSAYVRYAQASKVADVSKNILQVRSGTPFPNGEASTEVVFQNDIRSEFAKLAAEGAFGLQQNSPLTGAPIRSVYLDGFGNTVCKCETRELRLGVNFTSGSSCITFRYYTFGNLRDSDNESSTFNFTNTGRNGLKYPLWNWCIQFDNLSISE